MRINITIDDNIIRDIREYTNTSSVTEAVNLALKDWVVIFKIRELNKKLSKKTTYINNIQRVPVIKSKNII